MVKRDRKTERNRQIFIDRLCGLQYKAIGDKHGISITRVRQIIKAVENNGGVDLLESKILYIGRYPQDLCDYLDNHGYLFDIDCNSDSNQVEFKIWGRRITSQIKCLREAADDSLCKNNSRHIPAASGSSRV